MLVPFESGPYTADDRLDFEKSIAHYCEIERSPEEIRPSVRLSALDNAGFKFGKRFRPEG